VHHYGVNQFLRWLQVSKTGNRAAIGRLSMNDNRDTQRRDEGYGATELPDR
jgi:hypothetical protein